MKLTKKILSLFLACLMVFSTMSVAQAAVVDTVSTQVSSKTETVDVSKSNGLLSLVDGFKPNEMFERVSSTLKNIEIKNPFTAIKSLDFDTTKISANLAKQLDEGESGFERLIAIIKVGFNNAKLYVNNFITLSSEIITQTEEAGSSEVEYGVSSTYTATIPGYILATAPSDDLNVYTVTAENVVIPLKTELAVTILKDGQMVHRDDENVILDYSMYKVSEDEGAADTVVGNGGHRLFKVPAGFTEGTSADIYATVDDKLHYAGVYEEETVVFNLKVTDTSYTEEEVTELMFKIGKTQPEYVLAEFNEDFTSATIFANGEFSDGLMMDWTEADESNPFYAHRDTLQTITFAGEYTPLKSIGANAFNGCEKLSCEVVLPDALESIGDNAFKGCSGITGEISIPASVVTLGKSAFEGCSNITAISSESAQTSNVSTFSLKRSVSLTPEKPQVNEDASLVISERAFYGCTSAETVSLGDTVLTIGDSAFEGCSALVDVNTGASCTTLEDFAFKDCSSVERFVLPSVEYSCVFPFQNAGADGTTIILQAVRLDSSFETDFPTNANVIIGKTVEEIDDDVFFNAPVRSITFEEDSSLRVVGKLSFYSAGTSADGSAPIIQGLDTQNIETIGKSAFAYNPNLILNQMPLDNMVSIGDSAFYGCSAVVLEELYVPAQVAEIGDYAFSGDMVNDKISGEHPTIRSVVFNNECEADIGFGAFEGASVSEVDFGTSRLILGFDSFCANHIKNLIVPNTLKEINSGAFGCAACEEETCLNTIRFAKVDGCETIPELGVNSIAQASMFTKTVTFEWLADKTSSRTLVCFPAINVNDAKNSPECTIVYDVKTIENSSYEIDRDIYLDSTVTSNVKHFVFTDKVEVVGTGVSVNKYKEINGGNFPLANLKSITFGNNVKSIGDSAFSLGYVDTYESGSNKTYVSPDLSECDIVIPDSVEYIGSEAFWVGGYSVYSRVNGNYWQYYYEETNSTWKSVTLGSGIKEIGDRAFYKMPNATGNLLFGNDCLVIGDEAFYNGKSFNSISLGENVRKIGEKAFYNCSSATGDIVISDYVGEHTDNDKNGLCDSCEVVLEQEILPGETISLNVGRNNTNSYSFVPEKTGDYRFTIKSTAPYGGGGSSIQIDIKQYFDNVDDFDISVSNGAPQIIKGTAIRKLKAGVLCEFSIEWANQDKENDVVFEVLVEYVQENCLHNNLVYKDRNLPVTCQETGSTGNIVCSDCNSVVFEAQSVTGECVDTNTDNVCDLCGGAVYKSEIALGENITVSLGEKIKFVPNKTARYVVANIDRLFSPSSYYTGVKIYDSEGNLTRDTVTGTTLAETFTAGETYYIGAYTSGVVTIYEFGCCDKEHQGVTLVDGESPTGCLTPGKSDGVYCSMCEAIIEPTENIAVPHRDENNDGVCDICTSGCGNIKVGEVFEHTEKAKDVYAIEFVPSISTTYTIDFGLSCINFDLYDGNDNILVSEYLGYDTDYLQFDLEANQKYRFEFSAPFYGNNEHNGTITLTGGEHSAHDLGKYAFYGCSNITSLKLGNRLTQVPYACFYGCSGIRTVEFSDSIKRIDDYAFDGCSSLQDDIVIGKGILSIGDYAFRNCSLIPKIEIPNKDCVLETSVFVGCTAVKELIIAFENVSSTITESLGCASYGSGWTLTLMNGVKTVGDNAFKGITGLSAVDYGTTLESIGANAFYGCSGLTKLNLPKTVKSIGNYAYYGCNNIAGDFEIPESCEYIGNWAFGHKYESSAVKFTNLVINNKIKSIGDYAFYGCSAMTGEFLFPSTLENIGKYAFSGPDSKGTAITEVVMEDCNATIGEGAFKYCLGLITLDLGDGKLNCNASCFAGCKNLVTLNLGNGITDVPDNMFEACSSLTNLNLGSTLKNIGRYAFYGTNVTGDIHLPATLQTIGTSAFEGLTKMTGELVFTDNLVSVGDYAFEGCTGITGVVLSSNAVSTGANVFKDCTGITSDIIIPEGTTKISDGVFSGCTGITNTIVVPDSCTSVGASAFYNCENIAGVIFGDSVVSIGNYAFYRCHKIPSLEFPDSLESVGGYAFGTQTYGDSFYWYTNAINVPEDEMMGVKSIKMGANIKNIGNGAFLGCAKITTIAIPNTLETVGSRVFAHCYSLKTVDVPAIVYEHSSSGFNECNSITSVTVPEGAESLADNIFKGCDGITTVVVSSTVKTIGSDAFGGCYALKTLTLNEGLETIDNRAFMNCQSLRKVVFPNSLKTIGGAAFGGYANNNMFGDFTRYDKMYISSVDFGDSLERIEARAFSPSVVWECEITFPETLKYVGDYAFAQYDHKGQYYSSAVYGSDTDDDGIPDSAAYDEKGYFTSYGFGGSDSTVSVGAEKGTVYKSDGSVVTIPNRVTAVNFTGNSLEYIGVNAFKGLQRNKAPLNLSGNALVLGEGCFDGCSSVPSISVGGVTDIPNKAFKNCVSAESITLAEGLVTIGASAFSDCEKLSTHLVIPNSVTEIGNGAFADCKSLPSLKIGGNLVTIGENAFYNCLALDGELIIPDSVETIKTMAFYNCSSLDELYLGNGIKTLGDKAFYGFNGNITNMPSEIETIGENVFGDDVADEDGAVYNGKYLVSFDNIKGLESYTVKDGTVTICQNAFEGENLKEVILPDSVEVIASYAFADMTELTNVELSQNLKKLNDHAFKGCTALESLVLPESLSEIAAYAFEGCTNLKTMDLPETITKIGEYAFKDCTSYASSVTVYEHWVVGAHAFDGCSSISEINVLDGHQQIATYAFANCTSASGKIIVGDGSMFASYCFYNCDAIEEVEIVANWPLVENYAFGSCDGFEKVSLLSNGIPLTKEGSTINLYETTYLEPIAEKQSFVFNCDKTCTYYFGAVSKNGYGSDNLFEVYNETDGCEVTTTVLSRYTNSASPYAVTFDMEQGKTYTISVQGEHFTEHTDSIYYEYVLRYNDYTVPFATLSNKAFVESNNTKEFAFATESITQEMVNRLNTNGNTSGFNLVLLDTVKTIGRETFRDNKVIGTVVFPEGCELQVGAFNSTLVENVVFPKNTHGIIPTNAFVNCKELINLDLGGTDIIETSAFSGCSSLKSVRFDGSEIKQYAFANCTALEEIDLNFRSYDEKELGTVAWQSFTNCLNVETITLNSPDGLEVNFDSWITHTTDPTGQLKVNAVYTNSLNDWFCFNFKDTYNGRHVEKGGNYYQGYYITYQGWDYCNPTWFTNNFYVNGELLPEDLVIPDGVKNIYSNSIYSNRTITSLYVPDSLESIDYYNNGTRAPFMFTVEKLTTMNVPFLGSSRISGGSTVGYFLGSAAPAVDKLIVRGGIVNCINNAKDVHLEEEVMAVKSSNGYWDSVLQKLTIAGDETDFSALELSQCKSLKEITLFVDEFSFSSLYLTSTVAKTVVVNMLGNVVGKGFFKNTYVAIVNGLENMVRIEDEAFYNCMYLTTDMIFSDKTKHIGNYAFYSCDNLTTVQLGSNIEYIGNHAFSECRKVSGEIVVPESVKTIGNYAFAWLGNNSNSVENALCTITANIPNCTVIGNGAFQETKLTTLVLSTNPVAIGSNAFKSTLISGTLSIPDGSYIGASAFSNIPSLDEVVLGDIEYNFGHCSHKRVELFQKGKEATCTALGQYDIYVCSYCRHYLCLIDGAYEPIHITQDNSGNNTACISPVCEVTIGGQDFAGYFENGKLVGGEYYASHEDADFNGVCDVCESEAAVIGSDCKLSGELNVYADGTCDTVDYEFIPSRSGNYQLSGNVADIYDRYLYNGSNYWSDYLVAGRKYTLHIEPNSKPVNGGTMSYDGELKYSPANQNHYQVFVNTPVKKVTINGEFCLRSDSTTGWFGFEKTVEQLVLGAKAHFENSLVASGGENDYTKDWALLETIELSANNPYYECSTNVLYDETCTNFVWIPVQLGGDIVIPEGVTSIPTDAFANTKITSVKLASTITRIGSKAFNNCVSLGGSVVIPNGVTVIEPQTFNGCTKLESLVLHNGITEIGYSAFYNCSSISNDIGLPNNLEDIGSSAFENCSNMKGNAVINATCYVGVSAFKNCANLTSIDYRSEREYVSPEIFAGCSSATGRVVLSDKVRSVDYSAFDGCAKITELVLSPSLYRIGDYAFRGMSSLGSNVAIIIPENCDVGSEAFFVESGTAQIAKLHFPSSIKSITDRTFCGLNPSVITCADYHPTMKVVDGLLSSTNGKTLLLVPYSVDSVFTVPEQFAQIGAYAFAYTSKITDLTIPQTVKLVDTGAFMKMINLVNLTFEEDSVNWIEDYGFAYNSGVTSSIQLPSSLIYIGNYAFAGCSSLTWIGIPAETEIVGEGAFQDVPNATLDESNPYITIVDGEFVSSNPESFNPPYIGRDSLTAVQWELSDDGKTLRISGNGPMKSWGGNLMSEDEWVDSPFIEHLGTIETVIVEDGVTNIGDYAFFWQEASNGIMGGEVTQTTLKKVVLGKDVETVGDGAFFGNLNLETVEISEENPYLVCENNVVKSKDEKTVYMALPSFEGEFTGNENLETIAFAAFAFSGVTKVSLPETVKAIPMYAFAGCSNLTELSVPGVVSFGAGVVMGCSNFDYLEINSNIPLVNTSDEYSLYGFMYTMSKGVTVKLVGEGDMPYFDMMNMFAENGTEEAPFFTTMSAVMPIKAVEFDDRITSVTSGSFMFSPGGDGSGTVDVLKTVKLGKNLVSLGDAVFMCRGKLANIVVPEENKNFVVENGVLYNGDKTVPYALTTAISERLVFEDTVTTIPFGLGAYANKISSVTLGSNVKNVGPMAFCYVPKLERVEVLSNDVVYDVMAFGNNAFNMFAAEGSTTEEYVTVLNEQYDSNVVFMGMCAHENKENHDALEATCTTVGYTAGVYCNDCGYWIKGHDKVVKSHVDKDNDGLCEVCGKIANDVELNIEKSFECNAYSAIEETDPIGCYTWVKYKAPYTGTYSFEAHDETLDSSGEPDRRIRMLILKTDDVYSLNVNDEAALQDAYVYSDDGYLLTSSVEMEAGQTYWFGVQFDYSDENGDITVKLNYDDCTHDDCETISDGVEPVSCSEPGTYPVILCRVCNEYIRNAETWYMPHTDENDDLVCDICEDNFADIRVNDKLSGVTYSGEPTLYKFVAPVKGTYIINTSNYSAKKDVYDRNQTKLLYTDNYSNNLECELEEGETYVLAVYYRYGGTYTITSDFVVKIKDCPHNNTRVDEPSVEPVDCGTPGYAGVEWCKDCREYIHNGEALYLPHTDENSDGVCDVCGESFSDILPGQTKTIDVVAGSVTYLKFIPTETASYTFTSVAGNGDTYGYLYDENKNTITTNDDGGGSSQFMITYTLEAGKTYYWGARFYSTSTSGSFDVTLTKN